MPSGGVVGAAIRIQLHEAVCLACCLALPFLCFPNTSFRGLQSTEPCFPALWPAGVTDTFVLATTRLDESVAIRAAIEPRVRLKLNFEIGFLLNGPR